MLILYHWDTKFFKLCSRACHSTSLRPNVVLQIFTSCVIYTWSYRLGNLFFLWMTLPKPITSINPAIILLAESQLMATFTHQSPPLNLPFYFLNLSETIKPFSPHIQLISVLDIVSQWFSNFSRYLNHQDFSK